MCGIAGQVRADGQPVDRDSLAAMCQAIYHRGPDSRGIFTTERAGIAIQRLRVIDLETGDQPIHNEDRTVSVVLNGEIYNYRDLQRRLKANGHTFSTKGDTEVIVHLYEELGADCVRELHGMFAFALWDHRERRLLLARDRIGKKPLLYQDRGGVLTFASEMRGLLASGEVRREVDPVAVDAYLSLMYVPHQVSIFKDVQKLPPATILSWQDGSVSTRRYWRPSRITPSGSPRSQEIDEQIRARLSEAVRKRMVADVPIGCFLSGGIDSGAVVAAMARLSPSAIKTFSIGFTDEDHSELPRARQVAERYGTEHHELILEPDALSLLPEIVRHYGEPFSDTSAVPSFLVSRMASEQVTVVLNGDGGDESFAGYHRNRAQERLAHFDRLPLALRRMISAAATSVPDRARERYELLDKACRYGAEASASVLERHLRLMGLFDDETRHGLYSPAFRDSLKGPGIARAIFQETWRATGEPGIDPMEHVLALDFETYLPDDLCAKIDIATMAYSLEARSPFLDHEFVEFAATLPFHEKLHRGETKVALKRALRPWLPDSVLDGPKKGFGIPSIGRWLGPDARGYIREVLLDPVSLDRGYFSPAAIRKLADGDSESDELLGQHLWSLTMLELWHREFIDAT